MFALKSCCAFILICCMLADNLSLSTAIRLTFLAFSDIFTAMKAWICREIWCIYIYDTHRINGETLSFIYFRRDAQLKSCQSCELSVKFIITKLISKEIQCFSDVFCVLSFAQFLFWHHKLCIFDLSDVLLHNKDTTKL